MIFAVLLKILAKAAIPVVDAVLHVIQIAAVVIAQLYTMRS
jgi:hypothetical protein